MSTHDPSGHPHEIIIVKRASHDEDEGHHGGVWKVAFADFMTAMMAFFLVLWIINSTTRETKTSLARYFNPIKLTESTPAKKGLTESKEQTEEYLATDKDERAKADDSIGDRALPIEKDDPHKKKKSKPSPPEPPHTAGGRPKEAPDPVDPQKPQQTLPEQKPAAPDADAHPRATEVKREEPHSLARSQEAPSQSPLTKSDNIKDPYDRRTLYAMRSPSQPSISNQAAAQREAGRIEQDLSRALGEEMKNLQGRLEVKADPEGVLISVNEGGDFSMFAIGSYDPEPRLQKILVSIAQSLKNRPGPVVVRGHTDGRRYRGEGNDNWRLSSARAQATLQSLLRSGLDESRVDRVEGYASGKLKNPNDPNAPENRRIEILLRREQG